MKHIKSILVLFAILILSTGVIFAQKTNSKGEDFKSFAKKFFKDKKFQSTRIVYPLTFRIKSYIPTSSGVDSLGSDETYQIYNLNDTLKENLDYYSVNFEEEEFSGTLEKKGDTFKYTLSAGPKGDTYFFILKDKKLYLITIESDLFAG